jgi:hypothetical protein
LFVALPVAHGPAERPSIAHALDAVRLFAVGRVFRSETVMPMTSWLGIVVAFIDSTSFRPNDEFAVSTVDANPE